MRLFSAIVCSLARSLFCKSPMVCSYCSCIECTFCFRCVFSALSVSWARDAAIVRLPLRWDSIKNCLSRNFVDCLDTSI